MINNKERIWITINTYDYLKMGEKFLRRSSHFKIFLHLEYISSFHNQQLNLKQFKLKKRHESTHPFISTSPQITPLFQSQNMICIL